MVLIQNDNRNVFCASSLLSEVRDFIFLFLILYPPLPHLLRYADKYEFVRNIEFRSFLIIRKFIRKRVIFLMFYCRI